jgi:hypothetical protein
VSPIRIHHPPPTRPRSLEPPDHEGSPQTSYTISFTSPKETGSATLLDDGTVLITGGTDQNGQLVSTSLIYDSTQPAVSAFTQVGPAVQANPEFFQ